MIHYELKGTTVLVTGGAGFIGSHLVDALLGSGAVVRVLDNFETGRRSNINHVADEIELIEGDIRDLETCQRACAGAKFVLHQAALASVPESLATPANTISVNVSGSANVFTAARDQKVSRVVYASSSSVYGSSEHLTKREGQEGRLLSPYAISKWMSEELAAHFESCFQMQLVGLRYFNVYGPRQDPNGPYAAVIPRFFASCRSNQSPVIYGDGTQSRDFVYIADVVSANICALLANAGSGRAYNAGTGQRTTVNDLANTIVQLTNCQVKPEYRAPRAGDVLHSLADTTTIRQVFGWTAQTSITQGLKLTAAHF